MSRTAVFVEIDGYKVLIGFGQRSIDSVQTIPAVLAKLETVPEMTEIREKRSKIKEHMDKAKQALAASGKSKVQKKMADATRHHADFLAEYGLMEKEMDELRQMLPGLEAIRKRLVAENALYFELPGNEAALEDAEFNSLSTLAANLAEREVLTIDGQVINDNRGTTYYRKTGSTWAVHVIGKLGETVPAHGKLADSLTESDLSEINIQRIAGLTEAERQAERQEMESKAMKDSIDMRQALEIQKDPDALAKSQTYYEQQMAEIAALYG